MTRHARSLLPLGLIAGLATNAALADSDSLRFTGDPDPAPSAGAAVPPPASTPATDAAANTSDLRLRSWELPAVTVVGQTESGLKEEDRVGSYKQPRWTATRRFPTTRVYVIPEGKVEVEYWLRPTFNRDGTTEIRSLYEVEFGLPYRFQIDLYLRTDQSTAPGEDLQWGGQFEVRWALADWGEIWGNPTFYFEYVALDERPDKIEPKLLLGGELAPRWHWGLNGVAEIELGGGREHEFQVTGGVSYSVIDSVLGVGVENFFQWADEAGDRGHYSTSYFIGPSFQWKPLEALTINFTPTVGIGGESPRCRLYLNVGWEF